MPATERLNAALAGRYTIERRIGEGGMATVYLGRDVRHHRRVAVKVLRPELAAVVGTERFLSEIEVTANLQHPNLLPLFDSGEADGLLFYVMPFVEGESLRARLQRERQLPVDDAVRIAIAVARALDHAHRRGIIHRDLKPENILLADGEPLVADFGIALAVSKAGGERVTQTGISLGTPQYMSPEQAGGDRTLDARSDVYSLGAVLYEMLTGDPPHTASSAQSLLAKVLTEKPTPVQISRPAVSDMLADAVERSLEKIPADRFTSVHDMAEALGRFLRDASAVGARGVSKARAAPPTGPKAGIRRRITLTAAVVALIVGARTFWHWSQAGKKSAQTVTSNLRLAIPDGARLAGLGSPFALSPDGRHLAYVVEGEGPARRLYVRPLGQRQAARLEGTDGAFSPAFSPDGHWIAFVIGTKLMKIPTLGGVPFLLAHVPDAAGVSWSASDVIVVGSSKGRGLVSVPAAGGPVRELTAVDSANGETAHRWPVALRDGSVLYTSWRGDPASARIAVTSTDGDRAAVLEVRGSSPLSLIDGWLVYASSEDRVLEFGEVQGSLWAIRYDPGSRRVSGRPLEFVTGVRIGSAGAAKAALSPTAIVYISGTDAGGALLLFDSVGRPAPVLRQVARYRAPRFSPDGNRIAYTIARDSGADLWTYDIASGLQTRITTDGRNGRPMWTSDGSRLVFVREVSSGGASLWWRPADGSGLAELLLGSEQGDPFEGFVTESPNGNVLVYRTDFEKPGNGDIMYRRLSGDTVRRPVVATEFGEVSPSMSPDGRWIAYSSDRSGTREIYVQRFPDSGPAHAISNGGGIEPIWARDGRRLYYRRGDDIVEVTIRTTPALAVEAQRTVMTRPAARNFAHANYDVSKSGQFVMVQLPAEPDVVMILNWLPGVRERAEAAR